MNGLYLMKQDVSSVCVKVCMKIIVDRLLIPSDTNESLKGVELAISEIINTL